MKSAGVKENNYTIGCYIHDYIFTDKILDYTIILTVLLESIVLLFGYNLCI